MAMYRKIKGWCCPRCKTFISVKRKNGELMACGCVDIFRRLEYNHWLLIIDVLTERQKEWDQLYICERPEK
jgi:hypothetical protein